MENNKNENISYTWIILFAIGACLFFFGYLPVFLGGAVTLLIKVAYMAMTDNQEED